MIQLPVSKNDASFPFAGHFRLDEYLNFDAAGQSCQQVNTPYEIEVYNGYTRFSSPSRRCKPDGGGRKGITGFSEKSRGAMLKSIFGLYKYPRYFLTLTWPKVYPADAKDWKRSLDTFGKRLLRRFPDAWFYWKLEPQKRGAPHYHLIGEFNADSPPLDLLRQWVASNWYDIAGHGDNFHAVVGIGSRVDFVENSDSRVRAYCCKYVGKRIDGNSLSAWARPGRFWGIIGRYNVPPSPSVRLELPQRVFYQLRRIMRQLAKSRRSDYFAIRLRKMENFYVLEEHLHIRKILQFCFGIVFPDLLEDFLYKAWKTREGWHEWRQMPPLCEFSPTPLDCVPF